MILALYPNSNQMHQQLVLHHGIIRIMVLLLLRPRIMPAQVVRFSLQHRRYDRRRVIQVSSFAKDQSMFAHDHQFQSGSIRLSIG